MRWWVDEWMTGLDGELGNGQTASQVGCINSSSELNRAGALWVVTSLYHVQPLIHIHNNRTLSL